MSRARDDRHSPIAARLTGLTPAAASGALITREIALDWPARIEATRAGRALVATTANLVVRFCPQIRVRPRTAFAIDVARLLVSIDSSAEPDRATRPDPLVVHLGGGGHAHVTGSADGWLAYVSGDGEVLPDLRESDVVIGAHGAAAFVASQVFVRALEPDPDVAGPSTYTAYSLFEYGRPTICPPATRPLILDRVLLGGCGAVGQACVDVLASSDVRGRLPVVDFGLVDDLTNLNRSVLALERDLADRTAKVALAVRRAAGSSLTIEPIDRSLREVETLIAAGMIPWPRTALSALDNRPARWDLQSLWSDVVLEGATGETMAQIFRHAHAERTACLRCLHPDDGEGRDYALSMAAATGLPRERIIAALDGSSTTVTYRDVEAAAPELRELVGAHLGQDVCGMLSNVEHLLGSRTAPPQLSVAFSSYLAGTFLAGELIKVASGARSPLVGRYQIDPLANFDPDPPFSQTPSRACFCQTRPRVVEAVRDRLRTASPIGAAHESA
jgi:molybdopterin/thiamine biosynthesis adenylyltransferase